STMQIGSFTVTHAFFWSPEAGMVDLGTLNPPGGLAFSRAFAINDHDQVVGVSENGTGVPHAFLIQMDSQGRVASRRDLGVPDGFEETVAQSINNAGQVVGFAFTLRGSIRHAVFW